MISTDGQALSNIMVTGADGFIGSHLCQILDTTNYVVRRVIFQQLPHHNPAINWFSIGDIGFAPDWSSALESIEAIVHLAGRAHILREAKANPLAEYRRVNVNATLTLAQAAAAANVRRFVFVSSIGVLGNQSPQNAPFTERSPVQPTRDYATSKWEAEQALREIAYQTGLDVVIIRPPLAYGPGVPANFRALLGWVYRGIPLPLACVRNKRSLVGVRNLASFIAQCISHPRAANETFLISDGQDVSTPELLRKVARYLERPSHLLPMPVGLLNMGAKLLGKEQMAQQLLGDLAVNSNKARQMLEWKPPYTVDEELAHTAVWYRTVTEK